MEPAVSFRYFQTQRHGQTRALKKGSANEEIRFISGNQVEAVARVEVVGPRISPSRGS